MKLVSRFILVLSILMLVTLFWTQFDSIPTRVYFRQLTNENAQIENVVTQTITDHFVRYDLNDQKVIITDYQENVTYDIDHKQRTVRLMENPTKNDPPLTALSIVEVEEDKPCPTHTDLQKHSLCTKVQLHNLEEGVAYQVFISPVANRW